MPFPAPAPAAAAMSSIDADVAATFTRATGRTVRHRAVTREAVRDRLTATGLPEAFADLLAGMD
ncbi:hypothetical protein AB0I16_16465 [Streptomyces sp. NPDC050703]|uniref:hypothetical protein n=1 Tax=Streptomyces sp. NPDC050703 TaxID=3157218 RepID=UPI0034329A59